MPIELNTLFYCKYLEIGALHFRSKENKRKTFRAYLIVFQLNFFHNIWNLKLRCRQPIVKEFLQKFNRFYTNVHASKNQKSSGCSLLSNFINVQKATKFALSNLVNVSNFIQINFSVRMNHYIVGRIFGRFIAQ